MQFFRILQTRYNLSSAHVAWFESHTSPSIKIIQSIKTHFTASHRHFVATTIRGSIFNLGQLLPYTSVATNKFGLLQLTGASTRPWMY